MNLSDCACVVHVCAWANACECSRWCIVCAWGGIEAQKKNFKCVKHIPIDKNKSSMFNQKEIQAKGLAWVQFNTRMSLGHSVKHLACNRVQYQWTMHEHKWKSLNTRLECHIGPTQIQAQQMGLSLIKILKKFHKNKNPNPIFWKSPIFKTLS